MDGGRFNLHFFSLFCIFMKGTIIIQRIIVFILLCARFSFLKHFIHDCGGFFLLSLAPSFASFKFIYSFIGYIQRN